MRKFLPEQRLAAFELQQLLFDYAAELDLNQCRNADRFYVEDGEFVPGSSPLNGREAIAEFYARRNESAGRLLKDGIRTARHTFVNVRVHLAGEDEAIILCTQVNYAGEGEAPVLGLQGPGIIADCHIDCRREPDGTWRFARFAAVPALIGEDGFMVKMMAEAELVAEQEG